MELNDNVESVPDARGNMVAGRVMYSLVCRTHGRHTEWYLERAFALVAPVINKRTPHSKPIAGLPPEPVQREVLVQLKSNEPSGKEVVEASMDATEARSRKRSK